VAPWSAPNFKSRQRLRRIFPGPRCIKLGPFPVVIGPLPRSARSFWPLPRSVSRSTASLARTPAGRMQQRHNLRDKQTFIYLQYEPGLKVCHVVLTMSPAFTMDEPANEIARTTATFVPSAPASSPERRLAWTNFVDMSVHCFVVFKAGILDVKCPCTGGKFDVPPRHDTLCKLCAHSYSQHLDAEPVDDTVKGTFPAV
jgi:hypothetical protein